MNRFNIFFLVTVFSLSSYAQENNRYMVFLNDKMDTPFSIDQPEAFLSARAIERKGRMINQEDLPVTPSYISALKDNGANILGTTKWLNAALISVNEIDLPHVSALPFVSQVEYVAPGTKPAIGGRAADSDESEDENGSNELLAQHEMLNVGMMHDDGYYGNGMLIAVMDEGFTNVDEISYFSHLYNNQQVVDVHNFVTNGSDVYDYSDHGTKVFSTLAAKGGDYEGVATQADYLLYVTEAVHDYTVNKGEFEYRIEEYNWLLAAERADSIGVDIITTSLGYTDFDLASMNYTHDDLDGETAIITIAAEKAFERGIVVVSSAGNKGNRTWQKITPPSDGEHILAIGSVDKAQERSSFSSIGPINADWIKPDLMTMGGRTVLIGQSGNLTTGNGTSFAAPQLAGLVAGIWEKYPELTNIEMIDAMKKSADKGNIPDDNYGYGIPSYLGFENYYKTTGILSIDENSISIFPNPIIEDHLTIHVPDPNRSDHLSLIIYTTDGKKILETSTRVTWANNNIQLNLDNMSQGIYVMKIITSDKIITKRLVKQ